MPRSDITYPAAQASRRCLEDCFSTLDLLPSAVMPWPKDPDPIRQEATTLCCHQAVRLLVSRRPNGRAVPEAIPR